MEVSPDRRQAILAEVSRLFSEAQPDVGALCDTIARKLVELTGEACFLARFSEDGRFLEPAAHSDDSELLATLLGRVGSAARAGELAFLARVVRERRALRLPLAEGIEGRPGSAEIARRHGLTQLLCAPLVSRGEAVGAVMLLRRHDPSPHSAEEEAFLIDLAERAALAVDNARLLAAEREARRRAEQSEARYRQLFEQGPLPMYVYDAETLCFLAVNAAMMSHYGWSQGELLRMRITELHPPEEVANLRRFVADVEAAPRRSLWRQRKKDGKAIWAEAMSQRFSFEGRAARLVVVNDVTEKHALEAQFRQAQKMEAVGRLAGGVAHDFNNLLSVILTYSQTLPRQLPEGSPAIEDLREIQRAGERAAALTKQLLAFSRQQQLAEPRIVCLNDVLTGLEKMLRRLIGEDVELAMRLGTGLGSIRADPGQLDQLVMNLVVNSRDAMPTGGRLILETADVDLDELHARAHLGVQPGPHVMLAVSDSGVGMDRDTQARIFEPFFTTKGPGKGTGLGLSTVFGIVQQSSGSIWVYSEPGQGTTFKIYFPRAVGPGEAAGVAAPAPAEGLRGTETVLLVEDDDQVRAVARAILVQGGYRVLEAKDGVEALQLCAGAEEPIDLLVTDVVMPQMSGPELAQRLSSIRPAMQLLFVSGYTGEAVANHGILGTAVAFLQKPLTPERLLRKVHELLSVGPRQSSRS